MHYDVIIIGTGAGGGTLARHLAASGKRILLLERGDWLPREPENWLAESVFVENRYVSADTWNDEKGKIVPAADPLLRGRGDEALRGGALPLPRGGLRELRHHDGISPAWPIVVRRARAVLHTCRAAVRGPRRARRGSRPSRRRARRTRSPPSPTSRGSSNWPTTSRPPDTIRFTRRAGSCSTRATCPTAPASAVRTATGSPARAREVGRGGARRATGAPPRECPAVDERARDQARDDASGTSVAGVVVERDGETERIAGDVVVVSCGAANSAKLLLESANDRHPKGLANGSDQVGRNYMYHASQAVLALSREENPTVFQKTLALNDFYFSGGPDADYPLGNIQMVGKSQAPMFRGEKPGETRLAPGVEASSGSRVTRSTSGSRRSTCRGRRTASPSTGKAGSRSPTSRRTTSRSSGC